MISIPPSQSKQRYPVVIDTVRKKKKKLHSKEEAVSQNLFIIGAIDEYRKGSENNASLPG